MEVNIIDDGEVIDETGEFLSAEELLTGGVFHPLSVPELPDKNGKPGRILLKVASIADVFRVSELDTSKPGDMREIFSIMAKCIVKPDGAPLMSEEQVAKLSEMNSRAFLRIQSFWNEICSEGADTDEVDQEAAEQDRILLMAALDEAGCGPEIKAQVFVYIDEARKEERALKNQ